MLRLVFLGVTLATTAVAGYLAKRKLEKVLGGSSCLLGPDSPVFPLPTRQARRRRQPLPSSTNGESFTPLP